MGRNILVTGSHRSGSTWTGNVIAKAQKVRYVHEPFNIGIKRTNSPLTHWFECVMSGSSVHEKEVKQYLDSFTSFFHLGNFKRIVNSKSKDEISGLYRDFKGILTANRILIKDPIAIMSAEWINENYDVDVVVLIRHPAAFIASLKMKNWEFDFNNYLDQPLLMDRYLKNYSKIIKEYTHKKRDIIDQGILLWNTIHEVISYYKKIYKENWYFVKHENLSLDPIDEFKKMFSYLDLNFDIKTEKYLIETTTSKDNSNLKRNSRTNIETWKNRLNKEEILRIKEGTESLWHQFYCDNDW